MSLDTCPKCSADSIFVPLIPAAGYDGKLYGSRSEGFCNSPFCDQLLWYYPRSGRVTRRNVGMTLKEYTHRNWTSVTDLDLINIRRRNAGLSPLMEVPGGLWGTTPYDAPHDEPLSLLARLRLMPVEWFWWIVAALRSPFLGKLPSPLVDVDALNALKSGDKSINQVRGERGFDPVEVEDAE